MFGFVNSKFDERRKNMGQTNIALREYAKKHNVFLWEIADSLNCSEMTLTRKLRYELSEDESKNIRSIVDKIVSERT